MKNLIELRISYCDISQIELLAEGLKNCSRLVKLGISSCRESINSRNIVFLSESIMCCDQLEELDLSRNAIDSQGVMSLAEKLKHCGNLRKLDLKFNRITSDGVQAIVLVMEKCCHLRELNLSHNVIGIDGAALLVERWKHKTVLSLN